jgi:hypothetical protein
MKEPLSEGLVAFAMLPIGGNQSPVVEALQHRRVLARDLAVLWLLITHLDWRTGRCWITSAELAAVLGHTRTEEVLLTLSRLRKEGLVARGSDKRDPRRRFWCINPAVAATGGKHRRALQRRQFLAALE